MLIAVIDKGELSFCDEPTERQRDPIAAYLPRGYESALLMESPFGGTFVLHCAADMRNLDANCTVDGLAGTGLIRGPFVIVAVEEDGADRSQTFFEGSNSTEHQGRKRCRARALPSQI